MALVAPIFFTVVLGIVEFGRAFMVSQLLTLFITPVVYIWFDKLVGVKFGDIRFFRRKTGTQQPAE